MRICAVVLTGGKVRPGTDRITYDSFGFLGLEIILRELCTAGQEVDYATVDQLHRYDVAMLSLTAPNDVVTYLTHARTGALRKGGCTVIVGGAGCVNIHAISDYIDVAVFGRGEGQILDILVGGSAPNVWRKAQDPDLAGVYEVRQVESLSPEEPSCGCRNKCYFCQYTWARKRVGENYSSALKHGPHNQAHEEDLSALAITTSGRYTTAFDGLSEPTRLRINKRFVTDALIRDKFAAMLALELEKAIMLKVFCIVGYPWETPKTFHDDIRSMGEVFAQASSGPIGCRVMAQLHLTPFSPEPFTPMEHVPANVTTNWRAEHGGKCLAVINTPAINVFVGPYTTTPPTLASRVLVNRCRREERHRVADILVSGKLVGQHGPAITRAVRGYLGRDVFGWQDSPVVPYLRSYSDADRIGRKMFPNPEA